MRIEFTLPMPPSINRMYRSSGRSYYKTHEAKEYTKQVAYQLRKHQPSGEPLELEIKLYFKDKISDIDGRMKSLLDSLEGFIYLNDRQVMRLLATKYHDRSNPRVEVLVKEFVAPV